MAPVTIVSCVYGDRGHERFIPEWADSLDQLNTQPKEVIVATDRKLAGDPAGQATREAEDAGTTRPGARLTSLTVVTPWKGMREELERGYWLAIHDADRVEVLIVDDGSDPPLPNAHRIEASGFSRACNVGLDLARTDAVLFLNSDVVGTKKHWDVPIREALEPGVLVGAQLRYDVHGAVGGTPLPYLDGWCLAGMRDDLLELGGFDETYDEPAYYSDNQICLRARLAGMTLREIPVGLRHLKNRTAGCSTDERVRAATLANRERFQMFARDALMEVA